MVTKVWGKCEGKDISFALNREAGRWETTVPATESGVYIIELWAQDEAGNTAYFATIKVAFDTSQLCTSITILEIGSAFTMEQVQEVLTGQRVRAYVMDEPFEFGLLQDVVETEITKCEVCGL